MGQWRRHSREFKRQAVERMKSSENIHELARELGVERKLLYSWKYQFEGRPEGKHANYLGRAAEGTAETRLRAENERLKQSLANKTLEADFFKGALQKIEARRQRDNKAGETASTTKSGS